MADTKEARKAQAAAKKAAKAEAKAKKAAAKGNKPGFFKSVKSEMHNITWFSRKATLVNSVWVGIALVIIALVVGVVDLGLSKSLSLLAGLFA